MKRMLGVDIAVAVAALAVYFVAVHYGVKPVTATMFLCLMSIVSFAITFVKYMMARRNSKFLQASHAYAILSASCMTLTVSALVSASIESITSGEVSGLFAVLFTPSLMLTAIIVYCYSKDEAVALWKVALSHFLASVLISVPIYFHFTW